MLDTWVTGTGIVGGKTIITHVSLSETGMKRLIPYKAVSRENPLSETFW